MKDMTEEYDAGGFQSVWGLLLLLVGHIKVTKMQRVSTIIINQINAYLRVIHCSFIIISMMTISIITIGPAPCHHFITRDKYEDKHT